MTDDEQLAVIMRKLVAGGRDNEVYVDINTYVGNGDILIDGTMTVTLDEVDVLQRIRREERKKLT